MSYTSPEVPSTSSHESGAGVWSTTFFIVGIAVLVASIVIAFSVSTKADATSRERLLTRVQTAAYLVPSKEIAALDGAYSDTEKKEYIHLKQVMRDLRTINTDARFVYLMGSNGSKLFFYVDSEDPSSPDYSPPGQVYEDTSSLQFINYNKGVPFTEGPYKDSWGTWVSAYAPVRDANNSIIAIVGMDVDATRWQAELRFIKISIISIGVLLAILFTFAGLYLRRSSDLLSIFKKRATTLEHQREYLQGTLDRARVATWTLIPKTQELSFDEKMYQLTGIKKDVRLTRDAFESAMQEADRIEFRRSLERAADRQDKEWMQTVTFTTASGSHPLKLIAELSYGADGLPLRIAGTAHEVT